ncbi:MAG: hypothetical protein HUJ31_00780 [Pseudomonadales bacterium]|nr:hypothetical protein [Pseudomonadales bacterium]
MVDRSTLHADRIHLSRALHRQPEGIAFARDGSILIADEGKPATVTRYLSVEALRAANTEE